MNSSGANNNFPTRHPQSVKTDLAARSGGTPVASSLGRTGEGAPAGEPSQADPGAAARFLPPHPEGWLIGQLVEDPSVLPFPRPPLMKRMCCHRLPVPADAPAGTEAERCDIVLGWVVCAAELEGQITHGVCEACALRWLDDPFFNQPASKT